MHLLVRTPETTDNTANEVLAPERITPTRRSDDVGSSSTSFVTQAKENCQTFPQGMIEDNLTKTMDNSRISKLRTRTNSSSNVLSESMAVSNFSSHAVSLIENTVTNMKVDGTMESKQSQVPISSEDTVVGSRKDTLCLENEAALIEFSGNGSHDRTQPVTAENSTLPSELELLKKEMEVVRKSNKDLAEQKQKMAANLRKKRDMLIETSNNLNAANTKLESLQQEKGNLLLRIQKLTANRDDLKTKLVLKNEISREQRDKVEKLEKRLRCTQSIRAKELQLLQLYRQLSLHTGYYKWGKQIRVVEAELAAAAALDEDDSDNN